MLNVLNVYYSYRWPLYQILLEFLSFLPTWFETFLSTHCQRESVSSRHFTYNPLYYTGAFPYGGKAWGRKNNLPIKSLTFSGPASQDHDLQKFLPVFLSSLSYFLSWLRCSVYISSSSKPCYQFLFPLVEGLGLKGTGVWVFGRTLIFGVHFFLRI